MKQADGVLWTGRYVAVLVGTFLCYVGFQMLVPTLTTFLTENGGGDFIAGLSYSLAAGGAFAARGIFGSQLDRIGRKPLLIGGLIVVSRPVVGRIFDRFGHRYLVVPGALATVIGLLIVSYAHSPFELVIASLFYGLGFGILQPTLQAWAINRSPASRRGAANGTFLSAYDLGYAFGTLLMSAIVSHGGYALMYRASALLPALLLGIYGVGLIRNKGRD